MAIHIQRNSWVPRCYRGSNSTRGISREYLRCTYVIVIEIVDFGEDSKEGSKPTKG
jgi:hypothetical protein